MLHIKIFVEYDQMVDMMGVPRLTFLKNGKCGRCLSSENNWQKFNLPWEAILEAYLNTYQQLKCFKELQLHKCLNFRGKEIISIDSTFLMALRFI